MHTITLLRAAVLKLFGLGIPLHSKIIAFPNRLLFVWVILFILTVLEIKTLNRFKHLHIHCKITTMNPLSANIHDTFFIKNSIFHNKKHLVTKAAV